MCQRVFPRQLGRRALQCPDIDRLLTAPEMQGTSLHKLRELGNARCMLATRNLHEIVSGHDLGAERVRKLLESNRNIHRIANECWTKALRNTDGAGPNLPILQADTRGDCSMIAGDLTQI